MELSYKGFKARIVFSPAVQIFCGEVTNSVDLIAFQLVDLKHAPILLQETVDRYLSDLLLSKEEKIV